MVTDGTITCDFVRSSSECQSAAHKLGLTGVMVDDDRQMGAKYDPPFCYFEGGSLKFNKLGTNTGPCSTEDTCLCRQNEFCAKFPCGEGQGDCDNDMECEGSLVCGRLNCANNSITDCCTHSCNNDSDCKSGECNYDHNHCLLNSENVDWSKCSKDSQCNKGAGDCDQHMDCEGELLCGVDNCARGPASFDCCTGRAGDIIIKLIREILVGTPKGDYENFLT